MMVSTESDRAPPASPAIAFTISAGAGRAIARRHRDGQIRHGCRCSGRLLSPEHAASTRRRGRSPPAVRRRRGGRHPLQMRFGICDDDPERDSEYPQPPLGCVRLSILGSDEPYAFGLLAQGKQTGRPRGRPVADQPLAASSDARMGRSLKWAPSGRITATRRTSTWRRRRCASWSRSLVCSWALMVVRVVVRVVVIGTFFSDRVRLLGNRAVRAEGIPGDPYRRAAAGPWRGLSGC